MYDNVPKQFNVTLFSNASRNLYPNSTIGAFKVELPRPIELVPKDKWQVGLCEISYPLNKLGTTKFVSVVGDTTTPVYCELISPQYVGKKLVRSQKMLIYPTLRAEHVYNNVYYLPVGNGRLKES